MFLTLSQFFLESEPQRSVYTRELLNITHVSVYLLQTRPQSSHLQVPAYFNEFAIKCLKMNRSLQCSINFLSPTE